MQFGPISKVAAYDGDNLVLECGPQDAFAVLHALAVNPYVTVVVTSTLGETFSFSADSASYEARGADDAAKAAVLGSPKVKEAFEIGQGVLVTLAGALRFPGGGTVRPLLSWRHAVDELEGIA